MHRSNKKSCLAEVDTALNNGRSMSNVDALTLLQSLCKIAWGLRMRCYPQMGALLPSLRVV